MKKTLKRELKESETAESDALGVSVCLIPNFFLVFDLFCNKKGFSGVISKIEDGGSASVTKKQQRVCDRCNLSRCVVAASSLFCNRSKLVAILHIK